MKQQKEEEFKQYLQSNRESVSEYKDRLNSANRESNLDERLFSLNDIAQMGKVKEFTERQEISDLN